ATLGEGLAAGCATLATLIPALVIEIEAVQDDVVYRFVPRTDAPGIDLFGHDLVAGMVVCGREVTAEDWAPAAIDLHGSRLQPVHLEPFRQVLGTMPTVSDAPSSVRIRARDLQLPVPTADPTVLAHLHEAVAAQVRKRRTVARHGGVIQLQDAVVDLELGQVVRDGRSTPLTPREVQVLRVLSAHPNQVVTHEQLEQAVWTTDRWEISHAPAVTVRRLRAKLEQDPSVPVNLITVFGEGWTLRVREGSS
ncbi:MAG: winged helix-turn-helix domain-containing protein, partial [Myxococcales bacterium]|nr:winged helix-turn-helix domain-containing protein [Myxococcales bacterium]